MDKYVFLLSIIDELDKVGSWTGNTHIQKNTGMVQSVTGFNPYRFVIHHYGPYSFDLRNDLDLLVSTGFVNRSSDESGYHYKLTDKGKRYIEKSEKDNKVPKAINKICDHFGKAPTVVLELLSTIDYYLDKFGDEDEERIVRTVRSLKPHFNEDVIRKALSIWRDHQTSVMSELDSS